MKIWQGSAGVVLLAVVLLAFAVPASAHILRSDKGISAQLHVPPLDKAVAGELTRLQFTFEDLPPTFNLVECGCHLHISGPDNFSTHASVQLDTLGTNRLTSAVTFPKSGKYYVLLTGYATSAQKVQFSLKYRMEVEPAPIHPSSTAKSFSAMVIGLSTLVVIGALVWYFRPRKRAAHHPQSAE